MNQAKLSQVAADLREAEQKGQAIAAITDQHKNFDIEDAYMVQLINVEERLKNGARIIGKKVGLTSKGMQEFLGVGEPDFGHLFDDMLYDQECVIPFSSMLQPKIEAEIAFIMGEDLHGPGVTVADVLRSTAAVVPSFEIVASRIKDWKIKIQDTVADNGSSQALVLGSTLKKIDHTDLKYVGLVLERSGQILETAAGANVMGHPANAVAWLANMLGKKGIPLRKGEIVLSGSFTKAYEITPGDVFTATFSELGSVKIVFGK